MRCKVFETILSIFLIYILNLIGNHKCMNLGLKHLRNSYTSCSNENQCKECVSEGFYKKCDQICYCCNLETICRYQI